MFFLQNLLHVVYIHSYPTDICSILNLLLFVASSFCIWNISRLSLYRFRLCKRLFNLYPFHEFISKFINSWHSLVKFIFISARIIFTLLYFSIRFYIFSILLLLTLRNIISSSLITIVFSNKLIKWFHYLKTINSKVFKLLEPKLKN